MLAEIEDAIIDRCSQLIGEHVKTIESLPGSWNDDTLRAAMRKVPGIYVAWSGGTATSSAGRAGINGRYVVYAVTGHASGERDRRRGNKREIGAYEILECVVPGLHGHSVEGVGSLQLERVDNLYSDRADQQGVVIYGASFSLNRMMFPPVFDIANLADFVTFHANHQQPEGADTETHVNLQEGL